MGNKLIIVLIMSLLGGIVSAWEIEDVNGTWVYSEEQINDPGVHQEWYSWGKGWRLVDYSLEFDLGKNIVLIPGDGQHIIDTVFRDEEGSICLKVFSVEKSRKEIPVCFKVRFIDSGRVYIECDRWEEWQDKTFSPEEKWVWYRLSGPAKK